MAGFFDLLLTAILPYLAVLTIIVFVHEYGHFQVARWFKVRVDTFSIGFGKAITTWRGRDGTVWKIGSIPLGGYVKFSGDANAASTGTTEEVAALSNDEARRLGYFHAQSPSVRTAIAFAGPATNFIFSALVFAAIFMTFGKPVDLQSRPMVIERVSADSPAAAAGLQAGDTITSINGSKVDNFFDLRAAIGEMTSGDVARLEFIRDGEPGAASVTLTSSTAAPPRLGVAPVQIEKLGFFNALSLGAVQVWELIARTADYLFKLITLQTDASELSSVIGMTHTTGVVVTSAVEEGARIGGTGAVLAELSHTLLLWMALLSVAIGFMNLLPIPALDGGHIVFNTLESIRRKPLSDRGMAFAYNTGFALLIAMFLFASWNDLERLKALEFLKGMLS
jgi:regulator of sigma E protease